MRIFYLSLLVASILLLGSCKAKKELAKTNEQLEQLKTQLDKCDDLKQDVARLEESNKMLKDQNSDLKNSNSALLNNVGDLATLSKKEAENLEKSLESIQEKDLQINTMRDAITKKDSVTLALVTSLKGALSDINDPDIEVNVEKGVVYVSIADKLLFNSGSYKINPEAKAVLAKVAKVLNDKSDLEFLVEGHTDDQSVRSDAPYKDNWELSVLRSTAVVRMLQDDFKIDPKRMTAGGRSSYVPKTGNDTAEGRSKNRRTRIVILPKLDEFFGMIEDGMKKAK